MNKYGECIACVYKTTLKGCLVKKKWTHTPIHRVSCHDARSAHKG